MPQHRLNTAAERDGSLLSAVSYDEDATSLHSSRSEQDTDSEDDELLAAARNSQELRARDRLVLMEEEEMDKLVTDSRARDRRGSSLQRRTSNLALPNPIEIFRTYSQRISESPFDTNRGSAEDVPDEKRQSRRNRRKEKRDRLMEEAREGEDSGLMYEMEGGRMKDGSTTGDSSDRDDSDELDRRHLMEFSGAKTSKRRPWKKWLFIHTTIAVGFAFLLLLAWKMSLGKRRSTAPLVSNGTALFAPTTLIISLDGFRADFLNRGLTPTLNSFVREGVSPLYMNPSFPSVTFPNHYTLATGLYPESHGVVGNSFWDPALQAEFYYTDPDRSMDAKWWNGEPFWVTAELQGIRTAIHMWPGSEAHIGALEPSFLDKYNGKEELPKKANRILELLDKPGLEDANANIEDMRPQIIAAYVPNVDADGHLYGPNSTEIRDTIKDVDTMLGQLFQGLGERNLTDIVNVIIVSDHGMATTDVSRMIQMEDLVDMAKVEHLDGWPLVGIRPKDAADLQELYDQAAEKAKSNPNFDVYLKDEDMPERYHFHQNYRIAPLWIVPKTGWAIVEKAEFDIQEAKDQNIPYHPRGLHGYDHEHPLMRAIFIARGPAFPHHPNSKVEPFQNTNVYNILCDSVGMKPVPNNGTLRLPLSTVGFHDPDTPIDTPADPIDSGNVESSAVTTHSAVTTPSAATTPSAIPTSSSVEASTERPAPTSGAEDTSSDSSSDEDSNDDASTGDGDAKASGSWWDKVTGHVTGAVDWVKDKFNGLFGSEGSA
ncbi:ectonucleotide pyrophosphatase/phosphodiesterase family member 1 [Xylariomycetidae sp. FL0641]|nr:ectonucleotide pyrophosphatase/phosphodiesterase family member 1 [Xylariomycetidae sp. FL0641]